MKKASLCKVCLLIVLIVCFNDLFGQLKGFNKIKWESERIAPGLVWKSSHTIINDTIPQNINILIINTHKRKILLSYKPGVNMVVSKQAKEAKAIAAVNAGFFNIKDGGSVSYIRSGGLITDTDTAKKWSRNGNMNGSLLINEKGEVLITKSYTNEWYDSHQEYPEVLLTGPFLLSANEKLQLPETPLAINIHPRTAVGKRGKNKVLLITLDGRTDKARGMTLEQLTDFMISLHCTDGVNLDGGGSTTMWISGKPFDGVVNMPCDNKKFDHEGSRAVSDILIVK
jgi:exopolysaccharide biosynthesis protein